MIAGTDAKRAAELAKERNFKTPVYADPDGAFSKHFGVELTPTLITLNAAGNRTGTYESIEEIPPDSESALPRPLSAVVDSGTEIGTTYDVVVMAADPVQARYDLAQARKVVHEAETHLSEWKPDSDISRLNQQGGSGPVAVHGDLLHLITASIEVTRATGGAFDITWLPLAKVWKDAAANGRLPDEATLAPVLAAVGSGNIHVDGEFVSFTNPLTQIGMGGVAKGWIVDAVFLHLKNAGYDNLIVNIGGDLRTAGQGPNGPWTFQITDPYTTGGVAGTFELRDGSVATSGNYLRYVEIAGKRYGHILDPRTGWPAEFDGSVSVFTRDCAMADALATALFVIGPEKGLPWVKDHPGVEVVYVTRDGLRTSVS